MTKNQTTITLFTVGIAASIVVAIFLPAAASLVINGTFVLTIVYALFGDQSYDLQDISTTSSFQQVTTLVNTLENIIVGNSQELNSE